MGGYMSAAVGRKDPRTPVKGPLPRIKNFVKCHYKGLIGIFIPLIVLIPKCEKDNNAKKVEILWMWLFWFFLWQPVAIPVTAMIPIFFLPMTGVMKTLEVCGCYFHENIALMVLSGMLILLLNNSGVDRRIALWLICSGDNCQFSGKRLVFKCSTAAFFLSMFSNRLIVTSSLMQYVNPALMEMHNSKGGSNSEPNFNEMRYIINNAIQTSAAIGSTAIVHSSFTTLLFRAVFCESPEKGLEYEDIFNYMQFSAFAFPVALIQFLINFGYHMMLINYCVGVQMSNASMTQLRSSLVKLKSTLPRRVSLHEKFTVFFTILALLVFFFRWSPWLNNGWASFNEIKIGEKSIPVVKDSNVAALFVIALHVFPKSFGFVQYLSADKKSELPPFKPDSAILWWKFVDKNLNYGYIFVFGGAVALCSAVRDSGLAPIVTQYIGSHFTKPGWNGSVFLICLVSAILSNVMSGVAAVSVFLPVIMHMTAKPGYFRRQDEGEAPLPEAPPEAPPPPAADENKPNLWENKLYLGALAVGMCGSYGFMLPFVYTPSYICNKIGKTPIKKMAKYSFMSVIICIIVLWIALLHWAPIIWDPEGKGFTTMNKTAEASETP